MPTPAMTGDRNLQNYLTERYHFYHDSGYTKSESHSMAFRDMLQVKEQGYIVEENEPENPITEIVYSEEGSL